MGTDGLPQCAEDYSGELRRTIIGLTGVKESMGPNGRLPWNSVSFFKTLVMDAYRIKSAIGCGEFEGGIAEQLDSVEDLMSNFLKAGGVVGGIVGEIYYPQAEVELPEPGLV